MYDAACLSETPTLQRAVGELRVAVRECAIESHACWMDCARRMPEGAVSAPVVPGWLRVVTLNTSGGIAGGDVLTAAFAVGAGARATIAAQAAERFYRALPGSAASSVRTRIAVAEGGAAEWLPQETILFDRCAVRRHLQRRTCRRMRGFSAWRAWCSAVPRWARWWNGRRCAMRSRCGAAGDCCCTMRSALDGEVAATLQRPAIADGARAVATIVYVAPDAEAALDRSVRAARRNAAPAPGMAC